MRISIVSSVFNIPSRLKEIDEGYFVLLNTKNQRFEVHNKNNGGSSYCLTIPYDELDARTIELVKKSHVGRAEKIFEALAEGEEIRERDRKNQWLDFLDRTARDIYWHGKRSPGIDEARIDTLGKVV